MKRLLNYLTRYGRYFLCFVTAAMYSLIFNHELGVSLKMLAAFCYVLLYVLVLSRHKWIFLVGLPALVLPSALAAFFINKFNVKITVDIASVLLQTTRSKAAEFISGELVFWLVSAVVACGLLIWANFYLIRRSILRSTLKRDWYFETYLLLALGVTLFFCLNPVSQAKRYVLALILVITLFIAYFKGRDFKLLVLQKKIKPLIVCIGYSFLIVLGMANMKQARRFHPFDFSYAVAQHYENRAELLKSIAKRKDIAKYSSSFDEGRGSDLNVVLILGESARPDHFQLYGYPRETTPRLVKRKNLVAFTNVKTRSASTSIAVPNILTRAATHKLDELGNETSFLSLYRKHGFFTAWLSMNDVYGKHNISTTSYAEPADFKYFRREHEAKYKQSRDDYLLPIYRQLLKDHQTGKLFVVLHTRGSHWRHDRRYPKEFEKFPVREMSNTPAKCHQPSLVNAYDNSILFTDYIIDTLMEAVYDRNALVVYIGDHGESIGEDNYYGHSQESRPEQMMVPLIWWGTPTFVENYGEQFAILRSKKDTAILHDHFFHTLLDLTGFKTKVIKKKLSLVH